MKELSQGSHLPHVFHKESLTKKAARFVLKNAATRLLPVSTLIFAACSGGGVGEKNSSPQELENKASGYSLPFPEGETWYLTTGPHGDGYSNGIKYAIDIAPPEGGFCPEDGRKFTIDNRVVTASASGEVIAKGDDRNRNDLHHSEIRIKDKNGLTQVYIHLDNTKVKLGDKVKQGAPLGNPSCEYPPGGANTGPHVHIGLIKDGQAIPIDGAVVGGWTIHEGVNGQEGTMTKQGEKTRTASTGRYGENSNGIRNDLPNNPNRAVVASPKDPIPPISANVIEKKVEDKSATATTPKSVETKKEKWKTYRSSNLPYEIKLPASWLDSNAYGTESDGWLEYGVQRLDVSSFELTDSDFTFFTLEEIAKAYREDPDITIIKTAKRKVAGLNAQTIVSTQTIQIESAPQTFEEYSTSLITQETDGSRRIWKLEYRYDPAKVSRPKAENINDRFLDSFKLTQPSKSTSVEKKISISKKPDELFRALLTNPISPNVLPPRNVLKRHLRW